MNALDLQDQREAKDHFFRTRRESPLTPEQQAAFTGLRYYPHNPDLRLTVELDLFDEGDQMLMKTNRDVLKPFFRHGAFTVTVDGETATLTVYRSPDDHYFLPFADANAGTDTYGAGRYLDLSPEDGDEARFVVDFNLAYNPYCAYNDRFVCPVTPKENRIALAIRAGEMVPAGDWVG
jgi:uncharacterized protein (DUF1684 family)